LRARRSWLAALGSGALVSFVSPNVRTWAEPAAPSAHSPHPALASASVDSAEARADSSLQIDGLPSAAQVYVDFNLIYVPDYTGAAGSHQLLVRAIGFHEFRKPVNFAAGVNRYRIEMCPLSGNTIRAVPSMAPAQPAKTFDLTGFKTTPMPCPAEGCDGIADDLEARKEAIIAKACTAWDPHAHRKRGTASTDEKGGLATTVDCDKHQCLLEIDKAICIVNAAPAHRADAAPSGDASQCPPDGALSFSKVNSKHP
jgi:hypothetical protein